VKLITRDTDYAIRAICFVARNGKRLTPVPELVGKLNIPRPFLRKILQSLNRSGLLRSQKGPGGGFTLAVQPRDIPLIRVLEVFQGPFELSECRFRKRICPDRKKCCLRKLICRMEGDVVSELKAVTVASLLSGGR
jgi:Rrf2 family protein